MYQKSCIIYHVPCFIHIHTLFITNHVIYHMIIFCVPSSFSFPSFNAPRANKNTPGRYKGSAMGTACCWLIRQTSGFASRLVVETTANRWGHPFRGSPLGSSVPAMEFFFETSRGVKGVFQLRNEDSNRNVEIARLKIWNQLTTQNQPTLLFLALRFTWFVVEAWGQTPSPSRNCRTLAT